MGREGEKEEAAAHGDNFLVHTLGGIMPHPNNLADGYSSFVIESIAYTQWE